MNPNEVWDMALNHAHRLSILKECLKEKGYTNFTFQQLYDLDQEIIEHQKRKLENDVKDIN